MLEELKCFIDKLPQELQQFRNECRDQFDRISRASMRKGQKTSFSFVSPTAGGSLAVAFFTFCEAKKGWHSSYFIASGKFRVAPDWYIKTTTVSKKGFFHSSSSTNQEIVYVNRGVTQEDVAHLFLIAIPNVDDVQKKLLLKNDDRKAIKHNDENDDNDEDGDSQNDE
eukprot:TRINITY_DN690_c0_g1_i1.p1 TRINITY_DN690_c0_g1~~TRINITY_DN690_c0_g1_i1.p1  ORF type:complete len:168 (-),score=37.43 TRINITY_DN690_c0_g1_i1:47-550(-)